MQHDVFQGAHYAAGVQWGASLRERGQSVLRDVPFAVTRERREYAQACLPVYQAYYPEVLEEIQGIADGQQCDAEILRAVLLSMYAMPPGCRCSCLAVAAKQGIFWFYYRTAGREMQFCSQL